MRGWVVLLVLELSVCLPATLAAQAAPSRVPRPDSSPAETGIVARHIGDATRIDGRLDEPAWLSAAVFTDFRQRLPKYGMEATERTEVRVAYDARGVYVGITVYDSEPLQIDRRFSRRDTVSGDWVGVYLDTKHDHRTGASFQVTAAGVQRDASIFNDFQTDVAWDAVWQSAVAIEGVGWSVELFIPFSQLRFSTSQPAVWGINVERFINRKNESVWMQPSPLDQRRFASGMAHLWGVAGSGGEALELQPYVVGRSDGPAVGLDAKWRISGDFTMDATVNPDFGQVELDPSEINLTVFETARTEKRPFFLENSQTLTNFGRNGSGEAPLDHRLFYSRRIGRVPQGGFQSSVGLPASTTVLAAGKLTGKTSSGLALGLLAAVTAAERANTSTGASAPVLVEPQTLNLAARAMKESPRGGVGFITTAVRRRLEERSLADTLVDTAFVGGVDGYGFLDGMKQWVLTGAFVGSHLAGSPASIRRLQRSSRRFFQRPDSDYLTFDPNATSLSGWSGYGSVARQGGALTFHTAVAATSPGFEVNDLGIQQRADEISTAASLTWSTYGANRWTQSRAVSVNHVERWNFGGESLLNHWSIDLHSTFLNYSYASVGATFSAEVSDTRLTRGGPIATKPARRDVYIDVGTNARRTFSATAGLSYSTDAAGGDDTSFYSTVTVRPAGRITFSTGLKVYLGNSVAQFVTAESEESAIETFGQRYVFAALKQNQFSMTTRAEIALTPRVSLQAYLEPFFGVGAYHDFKALSLPGTFSFQRFGVDAGALNVDAERRTYTIDADGVGPGPAFEIENPDFNFKSFVARAVLRWEFRRGSTFYLAWTQNRFDDRYPGSFSLSRDATALWQAVPDNRLLAKVSYWIGR